MTLYEVLIRTHYWMILGDIIVMMKSFTVTTILTLDLRKLEIQFTVYLYTFYFLLNLRNFAYVFVYVCRVFLCV